MSADPLASKNWQWFVITHHSNAKQKTRRTRAEVDSVRRGVGSSRWKVRLSTPLFIYKDYAVFVWSQEIKQFSPITALRYPLELLPLYVLWPSLQRVEISRPKKGNWHLDALSSRLAPKLDGHRGGTRGSGYTPVRHSSRVDDDRWRCITPPPCPSTGMTDKVSASVDTVWAHLDERVGLGYIWA